MTRRSIKFAAGFALTIALGLVSETSAYAQTYYESNFTNCGTGGQYSVRTLVKADGKHTHQILFSNTSYPDKGYVWTSSKSSSASSASWATSDGKANPAPGYYDTAASGGGCN
jgi:hypothetical protein